MTEPTSPLSGNSRRSLLAGLAGAGACSMFGLTAKAQSVEEPDFGPNVVMIGPNLSPDLAQAQVDEIYRRQEKAHFTDERFAVLFEPGNYKIDVNVGFFTQIVGLGRSPTETTITGHVRCDAKWCGGSALINFWRGVENLGIRPPGGADMWAVSQAAAYRRIDLQGDLLLSDGGPSSGGIIADCRISGTVNAGSQQQWLTRGSHIAGWSGGLWNMLFEGTHGAPAQSFPKPAVSVIEGGFNGWWQHKLGSALQAFGTRAFSWVVR